MKKLFLLIAFFVPFVTNAATLRLDPATKEVGLGDVFVASIRVDVDKEECINAASVSISYPPNQLRLNTLSRGESIFTLWVDESINHEVGEVHFTSGIPGGYCGHTSGDPGNTNIIGKIVFQYTGDKLGDEAEVKFLPSTEVVLNDGLGTVAPLITSSLSVKSLASQNLSNEWLEIVKKDTFPPEIFTPLIIQDTTIKDSPYLIVFDTIDKQSGVEHYEIVEEDPRSFGFRFASRIKAKLSMATSPYILQDQTLSSRIVIRAYDHAGNMEEQIIPPKNLPPIFDPYKYEDYIAPVIILLFIGFMIFVVLFIRKRKNEHLIDEIISDDQDINL